MSGAAPDHPDPREDGWTLVIQTAFLGDVVLTTPLLAALARRHGPVDVVTTPAAVVLLETHPAVRQVIVYDKKGKDRGITGFRRLVRALRSESYARAYLPHRSWRSGALAVAAGIPERIGFHDGPRVLYTRTVHRPATGHEVERLLALAAPVPDPPPPVALELTPQDHAMADRWLDQHGIRGRFLALAPGSIWGTKRWPFYHELVHRMDLPVVIVGGPEDRELAESVAAAGHPAVSAAGELSLRASAALVARAALLLTNDSAPLHLATAVGTPIVAIFGPTIPDFGFGPRGPRDAIIEPPAPLECRPCSKHGPQVCPLGHHRCMHSISVETVLQAVKEGLRTED